MHYSICKIFESILYTRLKDFFDRECLLSDRQYGYRAGKSTELAIFDLIFQTLPAIETQNYAVCLFLDYSACFDTIDRNILIEKLIIMG